MVTKLRAADHHAGLLHGAAAAAADGENRGRQGHPARSRASRQAVVEVSASRRGLAAGGGPHRRIEEDRDGQSSRAVAGRQAMAAERAPPAPTGETGIVGGLADQAQKCASRPFFLSYGFGSTVVPSGCTTIFSTFPNRSSAI